MRLLRSLSFRYNFNIALHGKNSLKIRQRTYIIILFAAMLLRGFGSLLIRNSTISLDALRSYLPLASSGSGAALQHGSSTSLLQGGAASDRTCAASAQCSTRCSSSSRLNSSASRRSYTTATPGQQPLPLEAAASRLQRPSSAGASLPKRASKLARSIAEMAQHEPTFFVGLHNLRDNPGARQQVC